ncbi:MAG: CHAT domain-containing protein [Anaerolineales bacterium]|nr:CHAT domain-containing protein [Anaerolineales bacterium]
MSNNFSKKQVRDWLRPLRQWLDDEFSLQEVQEIIFNMGLDPDSFNKSNRGILTQELAMQVHRRTTLYPDLLEAIVATRPDAEDELSQFGWTATDAVAPEPQPIPQPVVNAQPDEPPAPTVKEFINFDLRVYPKMGNGTTYLIEASHDYRGGAGSGLIPQELDINSPEFEELSEYLQDLIGEHGDATKFGQTLYDFLFPAKVREIYRELQTYGRLDKKGIRLRLRVEEPELNRIPWEYCYHEDDRFFLAQDRTAPFVRHIERGRVPESLEAPMPLKILLVTAEPSNQKPLDIAEEERRMRDILGGMGDLVQLQVLHHASPETLQTAVTSFQPHVLHYVGHGTFDEARQEGALLFEQNNDQRQAQPFYAQRLGNTLRGSSVRLVVLNACKTSAEAEGKAFMGVAPALVIAGIPAVIAMQFNVPDRMAIRFTTALYKYLVQATPLDEAVTEMRIYAANGPEEYDRVWWAIPTLFMRAENGEIWRSTPERDARTAVLPPTDTIAANAAAPLTITKTITPPPDGGAFTFSQTISGSSGGININNAGNFNVGGNVTNIGGNQINNYYGAAANDANPDEVRQAIRSLQVKFQPALPQLDAADAADFNRNMEEAHTAVVESVARARRKLKNALDIAETITGIDPLLNDLEALLKRVETIAG